MISTELWHNQSKSWLEQAEVVDGKDTVLVSSLYSMISQGTERLLISNPINDNLTTQMRVPFMKGDFQNSFTYGYSLVGQVLSGNEELVHVMHPHQKMVSVSKDDITVLPKGMDPKLATLISNMETAVNAIWDANIELGDKILVVGFGTVGALISLVLNKSIGVSLEVLEINESRYQTGIAMGLPMTTQARSDGYDVIINASSKSEVLKDIFSLTKLEGKIIELGWYGDNMVEMNLGNEFHYKRIQLISSQVSHIPKRKLPEWDFKRRKALVIDLLMQLNPIALIQKEIEFQSAPDFYKALRKKPIDQIGVILKY